MFKYTVYKCVRIIGTETKTELFYEKSIIQSIPDRHNLYNVDI